MRKRGDRPRLATSMSLAVTHLERLTVNEGIEPGLAPRLRSEAS